MTVKKYVADCALRIKLSLSLVLVKLQGFPIYDSEKVCNGVCEGVYSS